MTTDLEAREITDREMFRAKVESMKAHLLNTFNVHAEITIPEGEEPTQSRICPMCGTKSLR